MKHYDSMEWILYKENVLSKEKQNEMEEHLYKCDDCINVFLSLIDKREEDIAKENISLDFTNSVMDSIQNVKYIPKTIIKKPSKSIKDLFGYYAAVAAVAIVLTLGGFYSGLVDILPQIAKSTTERDRMNVPNIISSISESIVGRTSDFINNFEISNSKEDLK